MGPNRGRSTRIVVTLLLLLLLLQQIGSRGGGITSDRLYTSIGGESASPSAVRGGEMLLTHCRLLRLQVMVKRIESTKEMLLRLVLLLLLGMMVIVDVVLLLQRRHPVVVPNRAAVVVIVDGVINCC